MERRVDHRALRGRVRRVKSDQPDDCCAAARARYRDGARNAALGDGGSPDAGRRADRTCRRGVWNGRRLADRSGLSLRARRGAAAAHVGDAFPIRNVRASCASRNRCCACCDSVAGVARGENEPYRPRYNGSALLPAARCSLGDVPAVGTGASPCCRCETSFAPRVERC